MITSFIKKNFLLICLAITGLLYTNQVIAQETGSEKAWEAFEEYFVVENVGNLHLFSPTGEQNNPDYTFYGTSIDRGLYGLFSANWRDDLPEDFKTYALYKIRYGAQDAYLIRFAGNGTQNMIGLFTKKGDKLAFVRTLSSYYCSDTSCWQMDSWLQDFDGDTRLDILQKARVVQYTLMDAPIDEYTQVLRQQKDGTFYQTNDFSIELGDYDLQTVDK